MSYDPIIDMIVRALDRLATYTGELRQEAQPDVVPSAPWRLAQCERIEHQIATLRRAAESLRGGEIEDAWPIPRGQKYPYPPTPQ